MKSRRYIAMVAAVGMLVAACGSDKGKTTSVGDSSGGKQSGTVTIANTQGQTWTCGFNPFNPAVNSVSFGPVYEPLVFVNALKNQEATPMLASDYKWSADSKTLTFTIRDGVKWSDGKPMSAADVLFTFNLLKKYPALDINAVWSTGLQSVTSTGNQVVLTFEAPALTYFYYVAGQTPIVPEHVSPPDGMHAFSDLNMMVNTGGLERTEREYRALIEGAGLRVTRIVPTMSPFSIIEAIRE
jgi:peptide/nickel transport system substrate-binding protein